MLTTTENEWMQMLIEKFRIVVPPAPRCTSSCAEVRIAGHRLAFNRIAAAELGYPEHICMYISDDATQIVLQATRPSEVSIPFCHKNESGAICSSVIYVSNKALCKNIRKKLGWMEKATYVAPAIRYCENGMLLFDLGQAFIREKNGKRPKVSDDVLNTYPPVAHVISNYRQVALAEHVEA